MKRGITTSSHVFCSCSSWKNPRRSWVQHSTDCFRIARDASEEASCSTETRDVKSSLSIGISNSTATATYACNAAFRTMNFSSLQRFTNTVSKLMCSEKMRLSYKSQELKVAIVTFADRSIFLVFIVKIRISKSD